MFLNAMQEHEGDAQSAGTGSKVRAANPGTLAAHAGQKLCAKPAAVWYPWPSTRELLKVTGRHAGPGEARSARKWIKPPLGAIHGKVLT